MLMKPKGLERKFKVLQNRSSLESLIYFPPDHYLNSKERDMFQVHFSHRKVLIKCSIQELPVSVLQTPKIFYYIFVTHLCQ